MAVRIPSISFYLAATEHSVPETIVCLLGCSLIALLIRWALLPKPLPGIPYNKEALNRVSGDVPELKASSGVRAFMRAQFLKHNSPIVQVFMSPISKPWVLIGDFREAHDIATSRSNEFDKSKLTSDSFKGIVPQSFVSYKADHPVYKHSKDLLRDLMTPSFFRNVSAPETYRNILFLVELWEVKLQLGGDRAFGAARDFYKAILDVFMGVTFDRLSTDTLITRQIENLRHQLGRGGFPSSTNQQEPVMFEDLPLPSDLEAVVYLVESINVGFQSPVPRISHWLYLHKPHSLQMTRLKRALIRKKVQEGIARLGRVGEKEPTLISALDAMLLREKASAEKVGIEPDFYGEAIHDELFTFIAGGHDNSASLCTWWVKFMTRYQSTQAQLRQSLRSAHSTAVSERRLPTVYEILDTRVHFLDAVIDETIRCSHIVPVTAREALVDTQILGRSIPKGTHVYLLSNGPSFLLPALDVDERLRTETARATKKRYGVWDPLTIAEFMPERWLKFDGDELVYNPLAGPQMAFGDGPRGCFGRKMVYLEMRIVMTLLTWSFEFLELGEDLNTFETTESSTENPQDCNIKLRKINY
ncbi:cytochrome P450 [Triangularia verruculosa]|uniref:Cytochrome P450 n=1 Tax=Triangularia verruculosa TaxID=2587418 RepID=A0AAN7AVT4_9PEZI|nr:cytochrome P450 [Triangularia verruculosa]